MIEKTPYTEVKFLGLNLRSYPPAGPIRTGIWEGGLDNVAGFEGPVYERALGKLRRFAAREWSNPAWFLPPEAVGERVWKVSRQDAGVRRARTRVKVLDYPRQCASACGR